MGGSSSCLTWTQKNRPRRKITFYGLKKRRKCWIGQTLRPSKPVTYSHLWVEGYYAVSLNLVWGVACQILNLLLYEPERTQRFSKRTHYITWCGEITACLSYVQDKLFLDRPQYHNSLIKLRLHWSRTMGHEKHRVLHCMWLQIMYSYSDLKNNNLRTHGNIFILYKISTFLYKWHEQFFISLVVSCR